MPGSMTGLLPTSAQFQGLGYPLLPGGACALRIPSALLGPPRPVELSRPQTPAEPQHWSAPTLHNHSWGGRCKLATISPHLDLLPDRVPGFSNKEGSWCLLLKKILEATCLKGTFVGHGKMSLRSADTTPRMRNGSGTFMQSRKKKPLPQRGRISTAVGQGWFQRPQGFLPWCLHAVLTN